MSRSSLERAIPAGSVVTLDTSAILAYLDGSELASQAAAHVIDGLVGSGRNRALIASVTVTETLVRPLRVSAAQVVGTVEAFLQMFPNLEVVPIDYVIAREGARVRALTALPTADALILATAIVTGADVVVGNDERWRTALEKLDDPVSVCLLADHATEEP